MTRNLHDQLFAAINQRESQQTKGEKAYGFYWTRKDSEVARRLIEKFSDTESIILDPFLGSGTTALGCKDAAGERLFIGAEINELPVANLRVSLGLSVGNILEEIDSLDSCLSKLDALYEFETERGPFKVNRIVHELEGNRLRATAFWGRLDGRNVKVDKAFQPEIFHEIESEYSTRTQSFRPTVGQALESNSRIAVKPGMMVSDVFGPLAFEALTRVKDQTNERMAFRLVLGAALHLCRLTDAKSQSQFPYWFPKQDIHEKSAVEMLRKKAIELRKVVGSVDAEHNTIEFPGVKEWSGEARDGVLLLLGDVKQTLSQVDSNSVDLVITDPPYFDQVAYSEYLKLWEFFTGFNANLDDEIVESSRVGAGKDRQQFLADLKLAFQEVRRVMKDGAFAFVYFKDSKPRNLHDFIECLESAGLKYLTQAHVTKPSFTYKQNTSKENTVGGDAVMAFEATSSQSAAPSTTEISAEEFNSLFLEKFENYLTENGPSSLTQALDNSLISQLYPTGYLKKIKSSSHFGELAKTHFEFDAKTRLWSKKA